MHVLLTTAHRGVVGALDRMPTSLPESSCAMRFGNGSGDGYGSVDLEVTREVGR